MGRWEGDRYRGRQVDQGEVLGSQTDSLYFLLPPSWGSLSNLWGPHFLP